MTKPPSQKKTKTARPKGGKSASPKKSRAKAITPEIIEPRKPSFDTAITSKAAIEDDVDSSVVDPDSLRAEFEALEPVEIDPDREIESPRPAGRTASNAVIPEIVEDAKETSKALATSDPVSIYLAEIRKYPLLTREQEQELAIRYRETGDSKAAEQLVTSNLRFVVKVAAEYSRFGAKMIDLIQEGNVGLMHAVKEFNPYKGVRLITYAVWWIRGYIQEYLMRQYSMVRIGTTQNQRKLFYRLQKEREALSQSGQEPTHALLAGRLGVTEEEVETMSQRLSGRDVSLSQPIDNSGVSAATLLDFEESEGPMADEALGHFEEIEVLRENIEKIRGSLNPKETFILESRLLADEPKTLQEIGEHFGITREAVRQLEARLIGKIRAAFTSSLERGK